MSRTRSFRVGTLIALGCVIACAGVDVRTLAAGLQKKPIQEKPRGVEVSGNFVRGEAGSPAGTLTIRGKPAGEQRYELAKDATVLFDDGTGEPPRDGRLADLSDGARVRVRLSDDKKTAVEIIVEGPTVSGTLKSVDTVARSVTVTISPNKSDTIDRTLPLGTAARVFISDGKPKDKDKGSTTDNLGNLTPGATVALKLSVDEKTVGSITAESPTVQGVVKATDAAAGTVTLAVRAGKETAEQTLDARNAAVTVADSHAKKPAASAKLADIPVGAQATVRLSFAGEVTTISIDGPTLQGQLKAVDPAGRSVTVAISRGKSDPAEERTLTVAADARLASDDRPVDSLDALVPGSLVQVRLSPNQQTVLSVTADGPTAHGVVSSLAADGASVTIQDKMSEKNFAVRPDCAVTIDGRPGEFAFVPLEAVVTVKLSADQKTARSISASGPSIKCRLHAVDVANHAITVSVPKNDDQTLALAKDVRIRTEIYGLQLKLTDLQTDKDVNVLLSADRKSVLQVTVVGE
jgi:hypothetical protein